MKIKKQDARYAGHAHFKYRLELPPMGPDNFHLIRSWFWQTFGPSKNWSEWNWYHIVSQNQHGQYLYNTQVADTGTDVCQNTNWCWLSNAAPGFDRVLLAGPAEVALFKLSHGV